MIIKLKKEYRGKFVDYEVEEGATIESVVKAVQGELPYRIYLAKVGDTCASMYKMLTHQLTRADRYVELLDLRSQAANLAYQNGLSLVFFKAMEDLFNAKDVDVEEAICKGLYIVANGHEFTPEDVVAIDKKMREIVEKDYELVRRRVSVEEAHEIAEKTGSTENLRLIEQRVDKKALHVYNVGNYESFFSFEYMIPSTGYAEYFELRKYQDGVLLRFPHSDNPTQIPEFVDEHVLFETFEEQVRWGKLMGITYAADINDKIEKGEFGELVRLSEALHERKVCKIADQITEQKKRIILIAGPSSSGKTTFAKRLCTQLKVNGLKPIYMGTDDYFVEREETPHDEYGEPDYENLNAVDINLFNQNMNDLLEGKEVDLPTFNFMTGHKEFGARITRMQPDQVLVIEGIHALNEAMTSEISKDDKFKIYISPLTSLNIDSHNRVVTTDHRMMRRMTRDYKYRGHNPQSTISGWWKVRAGENKNIFPYANEADAMFNSVHLYEIPVLKKYVEPLLAQVSEDEPEYGDARRMLRFLSFFHVCEDDSVIPNNSILREFIGGSVFSD